MSTRKKRLGVLLSGRGSNFVAIAEAIATEQLTGCEIAVVISNRSEAQGLQEASKRGVPALAITSRGLSRSEYDQILARVLRDHEVDLVILAGYMRLLQPEFIRAFDGHILNIHPSLLPAFTGVDAQRQALDYGVHVSGCTVHFVDEELDHGTIVMQRIVPVLPEDTQDTLAERILREEHRMYSTAIARVLSGGYRIVGRRYLPVGAL